MHKQLINPDTGEFIIENDFCVSGSTTRKDLLAYFGEDRLTESASVKDCYISGQVAHGKLYFTFFFYIRDERIEKIGFEIEDRPGPREPWTNNRDAETRWIATQMGDKSGFTWDMSQAGRHYHIPCKWGSVGVYYDFKNGTFDSILNY